MTTLPLAPFQDAFARALLNDGSVDAAEPAIGRLVSQPGFAVYRNTVLAGCIDALQANYPAVLRLVGEEWFRAAAAIHVRTSPPERASLLDYGAQFADFLAGFAPAADIPYLAGVARLDRFRTESHLARDEVAADPGALARLGADALGRTALRPCASARWAWFDEMPIVSLWRHDRTEALDWRGEGVLIVRRDGVVESVDLDAAGCAFLDACAAGRPLAAAAEAALARSPATDLATLLATLLRAGVLTPPVAHPPVIPEEAS